MNSSRLRWFKSSYSSGDGDSCVEIALSWHKSTYSGSQGDSCVEVALPWHKSTHSSGDGDDCVEVAACADTIHIRDSKVTAGPELAVSPGAWTGFLGGVTGAR
ncbi:DUF397 domain-containing protein [Streptomyces sp. ISL-94]|uniref:DUF397 domain-containing protein n=1 Tax=Streptomyces sp. ISL-94 TaxID=2819190 RepID=UPI001BE70CA4|nr:DUF397 domain-containing protein [Streptomyces sp. ISL-94]MBT2480026.1 DUF397 domain-containing protein [Streptomyces sp. ISL-94]